MDNDYLKRKANESYRDVMSIINMSGLIDAGNATNLVKANQGISHLCGLIKAYAYLQLYNENVTDPKLKKVEEDMKETLDQMQKTIIERIAELSDLEDRLG